MHVSSKNERGVRLQVILKMRLKNTEETKFTYKGKQE